MENIKSIAIATLWMLFFNNLSLAQSITIYGPDNFITIEEGSGGFVADLDAGDRFGRDHDGIGDVNGDGIDDIIIGARSDDDGQTDAGAAYIVFMNRDGTVQSNQKISMLEGGFNETLLENNFFGYGVAGIGDYDRDGIPDVAISAPASDNRAIYIIHLQRDGSVKDFVKNSDITAQGLSAIGDINKDGKIDLVACDPNSNLGGTNRGSIQLLFFNDNSQVISDNTVTIGTDTGGFGTGLEDNDRFGGREVAFLDDIDEDGSLEIAVGAFMSDGGKGAIWILSLEPDDFTVVSKLKIAEGLNGFNETLATGENPNGTQGAQFGHAMCAAGDLNGDGIIDLITGANQQGLGDAYVLYLNSDKTVMAYTKFDETEGGFNLVFDDGEDERFGRSISNVGDLREDGSIAINIGGGVGPGGTGTSYLLFFKPCVFDQEEGLNHWSGGNTLFSNWSHNDQMVTGDSLSLEQCAFKAFETDAPYVTYNFNDGRCICKDSTAVLAQSTEGSTAFNNGCSTQAMTTSSDDLISDEPLLLYPNPTAGYVELKLSETSNNSGDRIELIDLQGKIISSLKIENMITGIDLAAQPSGLYFIRVFHNDASKVLKVIKE